MRFFRQVPGAIKDRTVNGIPYAGNTTLQVQAYNALDAVNRAGRIG
jgi:hypothetical protein